MVVHRHAHSSQAGSDFFLRLNERNRLRFAIVHGTAAVVTAAFWRTGAGGIAQLLRGDAPGARRRFGAIGHAIGRLPELIRSRRAVSRRATVPLKAIWSGAPAD